MNTKHTWGTTTEKSRYFGVLILVSSLCVVFLSPAPIVNAQAVAGMPTEMVPFKALTGIPGITDASSANMVTLVQTLYTYAIALAAMAAVVKIALAGFKYMTTGTIGDKKQAKEDIYNTLLGLVIILAVVLIVETIFGRANLNIFQNAPICDMANPTGPSGCAGPSSQSTGSQSSQAPSAAPSANPLGDPINSPTNSTALPVP